MPGLYPVDGEGDVTMEGWSETSHTAGFEGGTEGATGQGIQGNSRS